MKTFARLSTSVVNELPSIHERSGNSVYPASRYLRPRQTPNIGSTQVSKPNQMQPAHKAEYPCRTTLEPRGEIMKLLNIALFVALGTAGAQAFADDSHSTAATGQTPLETYTYGTRLDIKRVIEVSQVADECGPVPARMTYEDSQGQRRTIEYQVMGTGCSNG